MPRKYALDECIVKGALEERPHCSQTIHAIVRRCDSIAVNSEWLRKCYTTVARHAHTLTGGMLIRVLNLCFGYRGKMSQEAEDPPRLTDESDIHHKDLWIVRLAVAGKASLVTVDAGLLKVLKKKGIACSDPAGVI